MRKRLLLVIIFFCLFIIIQYPTAKAGSAGVLEPTNITYPVPIEKKDGKITYVIEYEGDRTKLRVSQNKTWAMSTKNIATGKLQVDITVPYTEVKENSSIPTTISHQLQVYMIDDILNKEVYKAEFKVPIMKYTGISNKSISLEVEESTVYNPITAKFLLKSNPDDETSFDYIWNNLKVQTSNPSVVEIADVSSNVLNNNINITLKGKSAGKAEISLVSPTNQTETIAIVTVTGSSTEDETNNNKITENAKTVIYPIPIKKENGYIEYIISHPLCSINELKITQNKSYEITKTAVDSKTSKIKIDIPYTEVNQNTNVPTTIKHELYLSSSNQESKVTFSTEFIVPVITSIRKNADQITLYLNQLRTETGEKLYSPYVGSILTVEPDEKTSYQYILSHFKIKSSNENVLKIHSVKPNFERNSYEVFMDGINPGMAKMILVSPTNQEFVLRDVFVKNSDTYEIYKEKYFCNVAISSDRESIKKLMKENEEFTIKNIEGKTVQESEKISTGMKIQLNNATYSIVVTGDTNGDGNLSTTDLSKFKLHMVETQLLIDEYKMAADMNEDKEVTVTDLSLMKNELVKSDN